MALAQHSAEEFIEDETCPVYVSIGEDSYQFNHEDLDTVLGMTSTRAGTVASLALLHENVTG